MPCLCAVFGCTNKYKNGRRMFSIPNIRKHEGEATERLSERRRREWIKAIGRKDISVKTVKVHHKVCQDHFVSGEPSYLHDDTNVDWVPTVKMGHCGVRGEVVKKVFQRSEARKAKKRKIDTAVSLLDLRKDTPAECEDVNEQPSESRGDNSEEECTMRGTAVQTDTLMTEMDQKDVELNRMTCEIVTLKKKLTDAQFTDTRFVDNDENVRYYTGIATWEIFDKFIKYVTPLMKHHSSRSLTVFQEILMTCMKLRLNVSNKILGDIFNIHKSTVSSIFLRVLNVLYYALKPLIHWPDKESIRNTMPLAFVRHYGKRVRVIIDCFEVFIERPANVKARAETYSNYKHSNTIKYLIGITPQGSICFISDGWGGRTSDKHITDASGFLNRLEPGDLVLADRGFDIGESVGLMCAEIKIPAFTHGKKQLSAFDIERTRKLANVRIHVERVIGNMQIKYTILSSVIPIDFVLTSEEDNITTLDKLVTVCAGLTNLNPSVVPFT